MKIIVAAACLIMFGGSAVAAEATCKDYTRVGSEDRALFNGFIYGYVTAKIGDRGVAEVNTATARVKELADKYCPTHENDRLAQTIASFVTVVSRYGSEPTSPPSPWETHQQCEELALKVTYPRKLNSCADSSCKALTEEWMSEAVKAKTECLKKKLG
jgi:HdeA/HdeB family